MIPYYILQSNNSEITDNYYSKNQGAVSGVKDSDERFFYEISRDIKIDSFLFKEYDLTCEFEQNKRGRAYAVDEYFITHLLKY